jgi:hypothetical protein
MVWEKKYSICEETGLMVCEISKCLLVRNDGMVRNIRFCKKQWSYGHMAEGYMRIAIPYNNAYALIHRLVAEAFIPNPNNFRVVDHIDRNKINNNVNNLRWATPRMNNSNTHRNNKDGMIGATYHKDINRWSSRIFVNGETIYLGVYDTALAAHDAYCIFKKTHAIN